MKNYYTLLGLSNTANFQEIKAAYRHLAKKHHPDKNQGNKAAEEHFKEIQQAYAVLSNPEKRRKYDLKIFYGTPYTRQKQNTQYTGNAYQYAQQQAQQKKQYEPKRKKQTAKRDKTESHQVLVSIGIAYILLYFIISYNTGNKSATIPISKEDVGNRFNESQNKVSEQQITDEKNEEPLINDFDSPYSNFWSGAIVDEGTYNNITVHNSDESEAVVCLVENKKPAKTIRNQYLNVGSSIKINNIPDGDYFLKVYYGTNWDTAKIFINTAVRGGFKNDLGFAELQTGKDVLKMKQRKSLSSTSFSTYEIGINPYQTGGVKTITAQQFFK